MFWDNMRKSLEKPTWHTPQNTFNRQFHAFYGTFFGGLMDFTSLKRSPVSDMFPGVFYNFYLKTILQYINQKTP